jgi:hypothetical protein
VIPAISRLAVGDRHVVTDARAGDASIDNPGHALKVLPPEFPLVLPATTMATMPEEKVPVVDEKNRVARSSDIESSGVSSTPADYDDLPDPDVGKTDEERAKLVGIPASTSDHD